MKSILSFITGLLSYIFGLVFIMKGELTIGIIMLIIACMGVLYFFIKERQHGTNLK